MTSITFGAASRRFATAKRHHQRISKLRGRERDSLKGDYGLVESNIIRDMAISNRSIGGAGKLACLQSTN
jgi:hypothetical protein